MRANLLRQRTLSRQLGGTIATQTILVHRSACHKSLARDFTDGSFDYLLRIGLVLIRGAMYRRRQHPAGTRGRRPSLASGSPMKRPLPSFLAATRTPMAVLG